MTTCVMLAGAPPLLLGSGQAFLTYLETLKKEYKVIMPWYRDGLMFVAEGYAPCKASLVPRLPLPCTTAKMWQGAWE